MRHVARVALSVAVVVAGLACLAGAQVSQPAGSASSPPGDKTASGGLSALLQKGIYAEETAGDLDSAIGIYQQVVEQASASRPYAAQALYRLGQCYAKKGDKTKAAAQFTLLIQQYADQKDLAEKAKAELAKMPGASKGPHVVKISPAMANDVDPATDKITVTFDQPMMDKSWSWTGGGDTFPQGTGEISYDAARTTCTMPVKLEAGKVYWIGVNSPSHRNFKTDSSVPAQRYVILFATRSTDGKPTVIPADLFARAKQVNSASLAKGGSSPQVSDEAAAEAENLSTNAWKLWGQRKLPEAEAMFQQAVQKNPRNANAWNGLGWSQFNQGKPASAKKAFLTCVEVDPQQPAALNGLGWVAKGQGKTDEAMDWWKKAVAVNAGTTASLSGLASTYLEKGQADKAAEYYQMWLKAEPDSADAKAGLEKAQASAVKKG